MLSYNMFEKENIFLRKVRKTIIKTLILQVEH